MPNKSHEQIFNDHFGGVYYVMTGIYSKEVFVLSLPTMLVTTILLYIHTVMDYKFDR